MAKGGTNINDEALTLTDALGYMYFVQDVLRGETQKFREFLDVMNNYKAQSIDTPGVIARVKELFRGYPELILGFSIFLPEGYEIGLPES